MIRLPLALVLSIGLAGCQQGAQQGTQRARPGDPVKPEAVEPERTPSGDRPYRAGSAQDNAQTAADIAKLDDEKVAERLTAARRLAARGEVAIPQLLSALASNPSVRTRGMAAYTLGHMGDRRVVEALVRALGDPSADVRYEAAAGLLRLGDVRGFEPLIVGLEDPDPRVRLQSIGNLKEASGSNFGFEVDGDPIERRAAIARWRGWVQQRKDMAR